MCANKQAIGTMSTIIIIATNEFLATAQFSILLNAALFHSC